MTDETKPTETEETKEGRGPAADVVAVQKVCRILDALDDGGRERVLRFVWSRYAPPRLVLQNLAGGIQPASFIPEKP